MLLDNERLPGLHIEVAFVLLHLHAFVVNYQVGVDTDFLPHAQRLALGAVHGGELDLTRVLKFPVERIPVLYNVRAATAPGGVEFDEPDHLVIPDLDVVFECCFSKP